MNELVKIRDVSTKYDISARTLRYYEDMGLITSSRSDDYAYRLYDETNIQRAGADIGGTGQCADKAPIQVDRDWSGVAGTVIGAAVAIESLVVNDQPKEKESKKQFVERKNRQKKKQSQDYDWEISL